MSTQARNEQTPLAARRRAREGTAGTTAFTISEPRTTAPKSVGSFFVSSQIHKRPDDPASTAGFTAGEAHYSYLLARNKFLDMFRACGFAYQILDQPEIYFSDVSRRDLQFPLYAAPHLIFKPFEHVRLLKSAFNIACLAWEFDRLLTPDTAKDRLLPMQDYAWVASRVDEIWSPSCFTRDTFARHGIDHCHVIPAPIAPAGTDAKAKADIPPVLLTNFIFGGGWYQPRSIKPSSHLALPEVLRQYYANTKPKVFISVFNPADWRKDAGAMLRSFLAFNQVHRNAMLIVKFVCDPALGDLDHTLDHHIRIRMQDMHFAISHSIWVTNEFLPAALYEKLIAFADFYLCTSHCEGQNLPLLEAMNLGVVPVSVNHTAMADYLDPRNAILIPSRATDVDIENSSAARIQGASWFGVSDFDVVRALVDAVNLPETSYQALSAAARSTVQDRFGYAAASRVVQARLTAMAGS